VPSDVLVSVAADDDYRLGVLQSGVHAAWVEARCSTLGKARRYTTRTVFETFPWPQEPTADAVRAVEESAAALRAARAVLAAERGSLRAALQQPSRSLIDAQAMLDASVMQAYGWSARTGVLSALLDLGVRQSHHGLRA
jgi:hypothetical protein